MALDNLGNLGNKFFHCYIICILVCTCFKLYKQIIQKAIFYAIILNIPFCLFTIYIFFYITNNNLYVQPVKRTIFMYYVTHHIEKCIVYMLYFILILDLIGKYTRCQNYHVSLDLCGCLLLWSTEEKHWTANQTTY